LTVDSDLLSLNSELAVCGRRGNPDRDRKKMALSIMTLMMRNQRLDARCRRQRLRRRGLSCSA
jgi:hypothetical protein